MLEMWLVDEKAQQLCSASRHSITHMSTLGLFCSFAMVVLVELSVR